MSKGGMRGFVGGGGMQGCGERVRVGCVGVVCVRALIG